MSVRVAIIGAGPAGLGTAKCLLEEGHRVRVFEKSDRIGGIWDYREDRPGGVYETTVYQTSRFVSSFSDYPMSETVSTFPNHREIRRYLDSFADRFGLREFVQLDTEVEQATPSADTWQITARGPGGVAAEAFDAIAVCTGLYWEPKIPRLPGRSDFGGEILHSARYKRSDVLRDKRVAVVGNGVSGMDIAVEASRVASAVDWSFGEPNWIKPRWLGFLPYETGVAHGIHMSRDELLNHWRTWIPDYYEDYLQSGLIPSKPPFGEALGANDEIVRLLKQRKIIRRRRLVRLFSGGGEYEDGTRAELDTVVLATGYRNFTFPFFPRQVKDALSIHDEGTDLFQHVFHPELPHCAFIFHVTANAPALPTIELQARWFARVLSGKTQLPSAQAMRAWIQKEACRRKKRLNKTSYRSNYVDAAYLLRLAELAGALPDKTRCFSEYFEQVRPPSFPPIYRISGPHAWPGARDAVARSRESYPLKSHHFGDLKKFVLADCTVPDLLEMYKNRQISMDDAIDTLARMHDVS